MSKSSIPAPRWAIEVQLCGDGRRGAGRRGVAGGKVGPAFYCPNCEGPVTTSVEAAGPDRRPVTAACPACTSVAA